MGLYACVMTQTTATAQTAPVHAGDPDLDYVADKVHTATFRDARTAYRFAVKYLSGPYGVIDLVQSGSTLTWRYAY